MHTALCRVEAQEEIQALEAELDAIKVGLAYVRSIYLKNTINWYTYIVRRH